MSSIELQNVTLQYPVYTARSKSLRNQIVRLSTGGRLEQEIGRIVLVTALQDVSLTINPGDRVGLLGHNGAGKSTMLKVMSGIFEPTLGRVVTEGSITNFFEIGAGMDAELNGYENICRMGMQRGLSLKESQKLIPLVEDFAELGEYMSLPIRSYSSGMNARLAFAIATAQSPDILLIDEVFGAGDATFQNKARAKLDQVLEEAKVLVLATHSTPLIEQLCSKVILLSHGTLISFGDTETVLEQYKELVAKG